MKQQLGDTFRNHTKDIPYFHIFFKKKREKLNVKPSDVPRVLRVSVLSTDQCTLSGWHMALINPFPIFAINYASEKAFSTSVNVSLNPWLQNQFNLN